MQSRLVHFLNFFLRKVIVGIQSHVTPPDNKYIEFSRYERVNQHELTGMYPIL